MVAENSPDGEGDLLERIRAIALDTPLAVALDLHGNISRKIVDNADIIVGFKTYPHIDMYETGEHAGRLLFDMVDGKIKPVTGYAHARVRAQTLGMNTNLGAMKAALEGAKWRERDPGILACSVFGGFPQADTPDAGMSVVVVADAKRRGAAALAQRTAEWGAEFLWARRAGFIFHQEALASSIARARKAAEKAKGKPVPVQAKPASKVAAKPASKAAPSIVKNSPPHTAQAPAAKAAAGKAPAPASKAAPARPAPAPAPVKALPAVGKQSPRAAKAASMVPPPPAAVVPSKAAKSSYSPIITPTHIPAAPVNTHKDPQLANHWKTKPLESLTDADLMAMPDDEYMNSVQLAFFRRKLVQLKQDILNNAGETTEHLREDTTVVPDPADRATIEEEHALELRTRDRERKLLKKIEQSIVRIDSDDYGYCDETGEPIGVGRLLARPTATLSLEAQQRRELKQKMFGD
jgi:DnaK suppressor protein